ncbi:MAG: zf-HC2 domain-containing protein [Candidatus Sericytochromatia bacterium]|nr:zf-HC2 domain-containing protein [Candidatus Sericytochromatia bacterium]
MRASPPCESWLEPISAYLDGMLSVEEEQRVQAHLRACTRCTALLIDLLPVLQALRTLPTPPPGARTWEAIAMQLGGGARPPSAVSRWARAWRRPLVGVAVAAGVLALVGGLQRLGATWLAPAVPVADVDTYWQVHDAFEHDQGLPGALGQGVRAIETGYDLAP